MGMEIIDFKATKCKHCYKCVRYCEVKAIQVKDGRAVIMPDKCILCGHCLKICPQSAKTLRSDLELVKGWIAAGERVVVSIAPSYMGLLKYKTIGQVRGALIRLGFEDVRETSEGAAYVTAEYARLLKEHQMENIITTCCPSVNDLIEIYYPELVKYLAPVVSPMIAHGRILKEELGREVKIVFLGPCIAKKKEANDPRHDNCIDAVLNFRDMKKWLDQEEISIEDCEDMPFTAFDPKVNRLYPVTNGVVNSVLAEEESRGDGYRKFYVHGETNCIDLCRSMARGEIKGCFIEMNMCAGGCIKGPTVDDEEFISRFKVKLDMEERICREPADRSQMEHAVEAVSFRKEFLDRSPKDPMPTEEQIRQILRMTNKFKPEDELNCGACGYPTCREKAIAVYQGKADLSMCLPFLKEKAETFSGYVINNTPNAIFVLDENLCVQQINKAGCALFNLKTPSDILGSPIVRLLNPADYLGVMTSGVPIKEKKHYLAEYKKYVAETIVYDHEYHIVFSIMRDITSEEERQSERSELCNKTVAITNEVIEKQMRVVQEIASLLGETTAETKIALTQLKDALQK